MNEPVVVTAYRTVAASRPSVRPARDRPKTLALAALIAGACAIAFAPILVRLADTGPVASAFWRCALAVPLLWAWALAGRATGDPSRMSLRALAGAGAFFAADLGLWHFAVLFTSVANATLLGNISPIFVTLAGWLLWRQKVTSTYLVGMAAAIGGMLVLAGPNFGLHGTRVLGDALAALTGVFYAGYMLSIKAARDAGASAARSTATSTTVTALVLLPVALLQPHVFWPVSASGWLTVIGLAVVAQVLGQGLIAYAFAHLPAPLCSVILLVQPVLAAVLAWMLFGEAIAPAQFFGGAIVLVGAWLSKKGS